MPFGKNSCLTALKHFPRWHQLACTSLTESAQVFAQFCCSYLLPGCLINALHFLSQPSVLYLLPSSPIHPEEASGPEGRRTRPGTAVAHLGTKATWIKYGANWDKRRTPEKWFPWLSSGTISLNNFVKILVYTGFCVDAENGLSEPQCGEFDVFCIAFSKVLYCIES